MNHNIEEIVAKSRETWAMLKNKGLSFSEIHAVRTAFVNYGMTIEKDIEYDRKGGYYKGAALNYASTKKSDIQLLNILHQLAPDADEQKLVLVLGIVVKMLDVDSDYTFNPKR